MALFKCSSGTKCRGGVVFGCSRAAAREPPRPRQHRIPPLLAGKGLVPHYEL